VDPVTAPLLEEASGSTYRTLYFMRRAIGTLVEFEEALGRISEMPEFLEARRRGSHEAVYLSDWCPAVDFFGTRGTLLKKIRNDVGGHFGELASRFGLRFLSSPDGSWYPWASLL